MTQAPSPSQSQELEPLVLIPGMMSDARIFAPQLQAFSGFLPVMIAPPIGGDTVEGVVAQMMPQLPLRFALVGLGLGAVVAMEVLRRDPTRVARLCLMSASAQADPPGQSSEREPHIIGARTGRLVEAVRSVIEPDLLAPASNRMELVQSLVDMGLDLGPEVFVAQSRMMQRRGDMQSALRRCAGPGLVLRGTYDRVVPQKRQEFIGSLLPRGQVVDIPHAAHLPTLENAEAVNQALAHWLSLPV
ncbi:alpha/beta fold hydrolase [Epibacterium sp. SM1979]|uniref:Alpha/beta fold hydrolase n=1 Tax=Tritonibacter litoralis TaxID=2662264 RepID=A0A843YL69_9RHOB|nr:alpha/beta hydrolase [Tritonibacter litoralis]MQQ09909.1 alpha/beta fold hydrolase [Tritonibacter litoralis]